MLVALTNVLFNGNDHTVGNKKKRLRIDGAATDTATASTVAADTSATAFGTASLQKSAKNSDENCNENNLNSGNDEKDNKVGQGIRSTNQAIVIVAKQQDGLTDFEEVWGKRASTKNNAEAAGDGVEEQEKRDSKQSSSHQSLKTPQVTMVLPEPSTGHPFPLQSMNAQRTQLLPQSENLTEETEL